MKPGIRPFHVVRQRTGQKSVLHLGCPKLLFISLLFLLPVAVVVAKAPSRSYQREVALRYFFFFEKEN